MLKLGVWYKWKDSSKTGELTFIDPDKTFVTLSNSGMSWNVSYWTFVHDWERIIKS